MSSATFPFGLEPRSQRADEVSRVRVTGPGHSAPAEKWVEPAASLSMAQAQGDPRLEKMRALRTELLLRRGHPEQTQTIAILSPCAGEGRTRLAAELALSFAQTGAPTLLLDADFRHPHLHTLFGVENLLGLAQAIDNVTSPQLYSVRGQRRLAFLPSGDVARNPAELLSSRRFGDLLDGWRDEFTTIVIDTAPVANFADGLSVAHLAGCVLAVSRAQHTPYGTFQEMLRRLAATRSEVLGAVISHF
jgi:receptor protein-tyrosine kinase